MPKLITVRGQPSWTLASDRIRAHLTRLGGQLGPVEFRLGRKKVAPFSVAPWVEEKLAPDTPGLLRALRGDFFCAPFGANPTPWRGERHLTHGEAANAPWSLESVARAGGRVTLHASLRTRIRRGRIDKYVTLADGESVIYQRHVLSGSRGPMPAGHHAMLKFPETPGSGLISTSRFVHGQVVGNFELPENGGYAALKPGAVFRSLDRVPLATGGAADLTRFPARKGFDDLIMLTADATLPFAWTAAVFPGERYAWFSLRDPRVLRHTLFWISHGGRHYAPWNGRHTAVMGLEDMIGYFHHGLAESARPNALSRRGIPTALQLDPKKPTTMNYIMGLAAIPAGFDHVRHIRARRSGVELISASGRRAACNLDVGFVTDPRG
ncbi:MAG TPA: hypothetical protein VG838_14555 [Opitutaceae bacterium]|nr:hypothetical protein [Opitutaceae bacterium]